jgi:hypothetical protein
MKTCSAGLSFLSNITQMVQIGQELSESREVMRGVPQGSVLGPLLFIIYINDLPDTTTCTSKFFVDDAKIYEVINNYHDCEAFQQDISDIEGWSVRWQMGFNLAKCKCMKLDRCPIAYRYSLTDPEGNPYYLDQVQSEK